MDLLERASNTSQKPHGLHASRVSPRTKHGLKIFHRFSLMIERGIKPYPMVYDPGNKPLKSLPAVEMVRGLYRHVPWREYRYNNA